MLVSGQGLHIEFALNRQYTYKSHKPFRSSGASETRRVLTLVYSSTIPSGCSRRRLTLPVPGKISRDNKMPDAYTDSDTGPHVTSCWDRGFCPELTQEAKVEGSTWQRLATIFLHPRMSSSLPAKRLRDVPSSTYIPPVYTIRYHPTTLYVAAEQPHYQAKR